MRPGQQPVRVELDPLVDPHVKRGRQGAEVLAVADDPVGPLDRRGAEPRPAPDQAAPDDDVWLDPVVDVERGELGQVDGRGDPDDPVDVVLVGAVDRDLVAPIAAGPDPVVRDEVADAERQPEREEVRDQVMDAADLGEDVERGQPDDLGDEVEQVEREVAPQQVAADLAPAEHPQLDQDEVAQGRDLGREEGRPEQLLLPHRQDEAVERDLVDDDPGQADEGELGWAEEGSEEATDPRPAVPACGALVVRGLRHRSLGTGAGPPHRSGGRTERQTSPPDTQTPEGTNWSAGPFPPMQAPATRFRRTPVRSRRRRCKHLRRRFRSVMAPSGRTNIRGRPRRWLWGYPRTSVTEGPIDARCPRSVHASGPERWVEGRFQGEGGRGRRGGQSRSTDCQIATAAVASTDLEATPASTSLEHPGACT